MTRAHSLAARDRESLVHPFTNLAEHAEAGPLVIDRGEGVYVIDAEGRRYLEGMAGLWCAALGFSEARLVQAAEAQLKRLPSYHMFGGKSYAPAIELAERLLALAPVPMSKVLFVNSGSEANDTAVKLVRYYHHALGKPQKIKIISRVRAYHGVTLACASLTGLPHAAPGLRSAAPGYPARRLPALLSLRRARRERGRVRCAPRGQSGTTDPARGARTRSAPSSPSR